MMLTPEIRPAKILTPAERQEVGALRQRIFPPSPDDLVWSPVDWYVWLRQDGVMVSMLEIVERTVSVDGEPVKVGGIGGVGTDPAFRGRGFASQLMCTGIDHIHSSLEADFSLLVCTSRRISFYTVLGWEVINDPVYFDQPSGKISNTVVTMVYTLTRKAWPKGPVDFNGYPW